MSDVNGIAEEPVGNGTSSIDIVKNSKEEADKVRALSLLVFVDFPRVVYSHFTYTGRGHKEKLLFERFTRFFTIHDQNLEISRKAKSGWR